MLAVVEDQHHPPPAAVLGEPLHGIVVPFAAGSPDRLGTGAVQHGLPGTDGGQHRLGHGVRIVHGSEFGQPHPVLGGLPHALPGLLRQPGLPGPTGPQQRDEPRPREVPANGLDIGFPPDEGGETGAEVTGRRAVRTDRLRVGFRLRLQQLPVQGAQFGPRVRSQAVREQLPYVLVGGQRLRRTAGVAQGAQPEGLEGLVQGAAVAQGGQFGERVLGLAEGERGGVTGTQGVQAPGLGPGRVGRTVGEVGQGRAAPQGEGVVQDRGGLRGVVVGQRVSAVADEPLETVQVDVVRGGRQPVAAVHRPHGLRPERSPKPPHQRLHRAGRVGGRLPVPHLVHENAHRDGTAGPQREHGQKSTQPRTTDGNGGAVGAECLGGAEDAIAHGPIVSVEVGGGHGVNRTGCRGRA